MDNEDSGQIARADLYFGWTHISEGMFFSLRFMCWLCRQQKPRLAGKFAQSDQLTSESVNIEDYMGVYTVDSLSRPRLFRITAYLEVKILSLF